MYFTNKRLCVYFGALLALQIIASFFFFRGAPRKEIDFRTFYATAHMLHGGHLYDYAAEMAMQNKYVGSAVDAIPFMFPPYVAPLFRPLALFSYKTAYWVFFAINLGFGSLASLLMYLASPALRAKWKPLVPLLFLTFIPISKTMALGQVSVLLLLLYCLTYFAFYANRPFLAGIFLALTLIKFQIAIPIALLYLLWRKWGTIAGFAVGAATLALLSIQVTGLAGFINYFHSLIFMAGQTSQETKFAMFTQGMPNLYGVFHSLFPGIPGYFLIAITSLGVMIWAATRRPSFPLAILAALLVSYHLYPYDFTLLLIPLIAAFEIYYESQTLSSATYVSFYTAALFSIVFLQMSLHTWYLLVIPVSILFASFAISNDTMPQKPQCPDKISDASIFEREA